MVEMTHKCSDCFFYDRCKDSGTACSGYYNINEGDEDELFKKIEDGRHLFRECWLEIVAEYNDDLYF